MTKQGDTVGRMRRSQEGVILAAVAWLAVLITVLAMTLASGVRTETSITHKRVQAAKGRALVEAGLHRGALELVHPDDERRWPADGRPQWIELEGHRIAIRLQDEAGKIDLNAAPDALLHGLLAAVGIENRERRLHLVDAIRDWSDPDNIRRSFGAEDSEYRAAGVEYEPTNSAFERIEELRRVLGVDRELYERVKPFVTVHSQRSRINPWTASPTVLRAVPGLNAATIQDYIARRNNSHENGLPPSSPPVGHDYFLVSEASAFEVTAVAHIDGAAKSQASAVVAIDGRRGRLPFRFLTWNS